MVAVNCPNWVEDTNLIDKIYNQDCIKGMAKMKPNSVDLIVTDPPFAIDFKKTKANYNRKDKNVIDGYVDVDEKDYDGFTKLWIKQAFDVLKEDGSIYVGSGFNNLNIILNNMRDVGFDIKNHIIWKYQFGVVTKRKFTTSHYLFVFATKHKIKYNFYPNCRFSNDEKTETKGSARYKDMEDVWTINREYWTGEMKTPTKLPLELCKKMINYSSKPKDIVLDPFLGSGQVLLAAKELKRNYVGFEIVKKYHTFAKSRLNPQKSE